MMEKADVLTEEVPDTFVYEEIDGKPVYYRGYREALAQNKSVADIMGCSDIQGLVVSAILRFLYRETSAGTYEIITNEIGLHLEKGNNLSSDIAIYSKSSLQKTPLKNQYFDIPPLAVIEVDTNADTAHFNTPADYYHLKAEKLIGFGVQEVIWVFTKTKKVMVVRPQQDWITKDWSKPVTLLNEYQFSVANLIEQGGIELP